jgi:hypothetical protein
MKRGTEIILNVEPGKSLLIVALVVPLPQTLLSVELYEQKKNHFKKFNFVLDPFMKL